MLHDCFHCSHYFQVPKVYTTFLLLLIKLHKIIYIRGIAKEKKKKLKYFLQV